MSVIIETLEEKREQVYESIHEYESSIANHAKDMEAATSNLTFLVGLQNEMKHVNDHIQAKNVHFYTGHSFREDRIDLKKYSQEMTSELYRQVQEAQKRIEQLPKSKVSWQNHIDELKDEIEEINKEIEKQKKS